jgi:hypothetical protein
MTRNWLSYPSAEFANCTVYLPDVDNNGHAIMAVRETMDGHSVILFAGGNEVPVMRTAKTVMADLVPPPDPPVFVGRLNPDAPTATFSGAADPGSTVVIRDGAVLAATAQTDATGQWETTSPVDLTPGPHTMIAIQTDIFGRESKSSTPCLLDVPEPKPLPEPPTLVVPETASGPAGTPIALPITASLAGADASDPDAVLSIGILGVPSDATLSAGTRNSDGSYTLTEPQLSGLTITTTAAPTAFPLSVSAASTSRGNTAAAGGVINVTTSAPVPLPATAPTIAENKPLSVIVGAAGTITSGDLSANEPGASPSQLTYTVTGGPSNGTLLKGGSPVTQFTQADIDSGAVSYQENGSGATADEFAFQVADPAGGTTTGTFGITISPAEPVTTGVTATAGGPGFATPPPVTITGGGTTTAADPANPAPQQQPE